MLLPGTFLGFGNLVAISLARGAGNLSPAWLQAHGQALLFGWIGSFILGIGFYSLTKMQSTLTFPVAAGWLSWSVWTLGAALRWIAGISAWHWRFLLPVSALLELLGFVVFARSIGKHRSPSPHARTEPWLKLVIAATLGFFVVLVVNLGMAISVARYGNGPALPHVQDQELVLLSVWGMCVLTIWAFNARWLSVFAGLPKPRDRSLTTAFVLTGVAFVSLVVNWIALAAVAFLVASFFAIDGVRIWDRPLRPAKLVNIHPSFLTFLRIAYFWLIVSCLLFTLAVTADRSGGIWGASRHSLTVGFVAGMVFVIGPRVLPAFCGMRVLWSTRLMFWSLLLLHAGCALRVVAEPLAYEKSLALAWFWLPVSAFVELTAFFLFALNIAVTLWQPPAHLRQGVSTR